MAMRREDSNFFLTYICDDGSYDWVSSMDICQCEEEDEEKVEPVYNGTGMSSAIWPFLNV